MAKQEIIITSKTEGGDKPSSSSRSGPSPPSPEVQRSEQQQPVEASETKRRRAIGAARREQEAEYAEYREDPDVSYQRAQEMRRERIERGEERSPPDVEATDVPELQTDKDPDVQASGVTEKQPTSAEPVERTKTQQYWDEVQEVKENLPEDVQAATGSTSVARTIVSERRKKDEALRLKEEAANARSSSGEDPDEVSFDDDDTKEAKPPKHLLLKVWDAFFEGMDDFFSIVFNRQNALNLARTLIGKALGEKQDEDEDSPSARISRGVQSVLGRREHTEAQDDDDDGMNLADSLIEADEKDNILQQQTTTSEEREEEDLGDFEQTIESQDDSSGEQQDTRLQREEDEDEDKDFDIRSAVDDADHAQQANDLKNQSNRARARTGRATPKGQPTAVTGGAAVGGAEVAGGAAARTGASAGTSVAGGASAAGGAGVASGGGAAAGGSGAGAAAAGAAGAGGVAAAATGVGIVVAAFAVAAAGAYVLHKGFQVLENAMESASKEIEAFSGAIVQSTVEVDLLVMQKRMERGNTLEQEFVEFHEQRANMAEILEDIKTNFLAVMLPVIVVISKILEFVFRILRVIWLIVVAIFNALMAAVNFVISLGGLLPDMGELLHGLLDGLNAIAKTLEWLFGKADASEGHWGGDMGAFFSPPGADLVEAERGNNQGDGWFDNLGGALLYGSLGFLRGGWGGAAVGAISGWNAMD